MYKVDINEIITKQFLNEVELNLNNMYKIVERSEGMYIYLYNAIIGRLIEITKESLTLDCSSEYNANEITVLIKDIEEIKILKGDE